jgi:hypothetical protein
VSSSADRSSRLWWLISTGVLVAASGILVAGLFTAFGSQSPDELGWDFRTAYLPAAEAVVHGRSPYPDPNDPNLDVPTTYAYPPQVALALAALTPVRENAAVVVAVLACVAALGGALALVGVRDIRCYAVVPIWGAGWNALEMANISAFLALGLALVWRYRSTLWPLSLALAGLVTVKLFLWPVLVWALVTRRIRATMLAVLVGTVSTLLAWAAIGFAGLTSYPEILRLIADQKSYSIDGMSRSLGAGHVAATIATIIVGGAVVAACAITAGRGDERRAFALAVAAALALSPVVWLHYLVLLVIPLGLMRPAFSWIWLLPIVLWVSPRSENGVGVEPFVPALVATVIFAVLLIRPDERGQERMRGATA